MFEYLFPALIIPVALLKLNGDDRDRKTLDKIFENIGYGFKDSNNKFVKPKFKKKVPILDEGETIGYTYMYSIPAGLPATRTSDMEERTNIFSDGLGRPVLIKFDYAKELKGKKYLQFSIFNRDIPKLYKYDELPLKTNKWVIPLGMALDGLKWHNFDHIPHMTVAGTTRFGKTVFLRMLMTYLIECHKDDVSFHIIDLKGGLEFGRYECIRQVKDVASDPVEALESLSQILEEVQRDFNYFRKKFWSNIVDTPLKHRKFIIVDEAAQLTPEKWMPTNMKKALEHCQSMLSEIARLGGSLGYRLIYATQYPTADTLPRQIKMNADAKISYRLPSGYASGVAIDDYGAERLPSDIKGRMLFKNHELREIQTPYLTHDQMWEKLSQYQEPVLLEGEAENVVEQPSGNHLIHFRKA